MIDQGPNWDGKEPIKGLETREKLLNIVETAIKIEVCVFWSFISAPRAREPNLENENFYVGLNISPAIQSFCCNVTECVLKFLFVFKLFHISNKRFNIS